MARVRAYGYRKRSVNERFFVEKESTTKKEVSVTPTNEAMPPDLAQENEVEEQIMEQAQVDPNVDPEEEEQEAVETSEPEEESKEVTTGEEPTIQQQAEMLSEQFFDLPEEKRNEHLLAIKEQNAELYELIIGELRDLGVAIPDEV